MDQILSSLKKQVNSHRYLCVFTQNEINIILQPYVKVLYSFQYLKTKYTIKIKNPQTVIYTEELMDTYNEILDDIISNSIIELYNQFKIKIKIPKCYDTFIIDNLMKHMRGCNPKKFSKHNDK
jgi:hypothetical protein